MEQNNRRLVIAIQLAIIVLVGGLIYSNTLQVPFVFDDEDYVHGNPVLKDFRGFGDAEYAEKLMRKGLLNQNFRTRIVTFFTFALNQQFLGNSLVGYHLVNLAIHLANGILVYWLLRLTLQTPFGRQDGWGRGSPGTLALLTALLFVSHPLQTQAITYISQRFTALATLFCLLSLGCYSSWRLAGIATPVPAEDSPRPGWLGKRPLFYGLALASALLAMKSKEIAFTLPLMICMYEYCFFPGPSRRPFLLVPFLLTMLIIPMTLLGARAKYYDIDCLVCGVDETGAGTVLNYFFTQFRVIVTYLRLLILPLNQNLDYSYPLATGFFQRPVFLSFLLLVGVLALGGYLWARSAKAGGLQAMCMRLIAFGIFWFFLALAVESSLLPLKDVIFEHRLYLPSVGFCFALIAVGALVHARLGLAGRKMLLLGTVALIAAWSGATYSRNMVWQDSLTLWRDAARKSPDKYRPHFVLGTIYEERGREEDAIREYQEALKFDPVSIDALSHLGVIYLKKGDERAALVFLERTAKSKDASLVPRLYNSLGDLYLNAGRLPEAESALLQALPLDEHPENSLRQLGEVYLRQGRSAAALRALEMAVQLDPKNSDSQCLLGTIRAGNRDYSGAVQALQRALVLDPRNASARQQLERVLALQKH